MNQYYKKYQLNFVIFSPPFQANIGGVIALYNLARIIDEAGFLCKIFDMNGLNLPNSIFDNYGTEADVNDNTVVVYPEVTFGNPLKAQYVVRWILCELGIHCPSDIYTTWGKDDFIYHYGTYNSQKDVKDYNLICPIYINPALKNYGKSRDGYCHIIRKGHKFHNPLKYIHPSESLFLDDNLSQEILIEIFNRKEYLISYDPYSYICAIAALCGCIPIIVPIAGTTKEEWFKSLSASVILEESGECKIKGFAYGLEEVEYARNTLQEVRYQQEIQVKYGKESVSRFINDMVDIICHESGLLPKNERILKVKNIFPGGDSETKREKNKHELENFFVNIVHKIVDNNEELNYVKFLFSHQSYFQEIGKADNYSQYLQKCIDYVHTSIFNKPDSQFWHEVVNNFAQVTNFIPVYFNENNLKNIYVKRAEILECFLKNNRHIVDYEFLERPINRKKIRLGILASHFTPSAETFAYLPVYEYLSRDFEVILYSLNKTGHPLEQYCELSANSFKLLPQKLSEQVNTIRDDDLDILFIATNVTAATNQICLLAIHRLARIQVTSGGSVVTTGMRNIDYYISGTFTDPSPRAQDHYQEKLIKLEGTAHCFSYGNEEGKLTNPVERNSLGIGEDAVVFISGANYFKTVPELIHVWAKIIFKVPNSVLVLLPFGPNWSNNYPKIEFINHLNSIFYKHGLSTERLRVLDPYPIPDREDMKEYYKIADIYLDSFPFAGTTSLVEPLQVNLPVIARQGTTFRSAMGAAMVQALDIPDLVADSEESYIQLAIALGNDPKLRQQKSAEIKEKMQGNPSFLDSRSYSAKMGNLFEKLLSKYFADTLSQNLQLRDINLIIFPDWSQPEESLGLVLEQLIKTLLSYAESEQITLIINTSNIATEDAEIFLSSVSMNLLIQEDLDINNGLQISLLGNLSHIEWQALLPRIHARLILEYEDREALTKIPVKNLVSYELDNWISQSKLLIKQNLHN
ncbi:putative glycosyltransferase [Nostoc linckia NIES-25]|nr:putative glycosyltransferase [Nostoc linckia NIES-25]